MRTVLIIEDDEGIRNAIELMLDYGGYGVKTASNGKEGLECLSQMEHPCLILLDLMMPVMDGWTFAERVQMDPELRQIPIVIVTAFEKEALAVKNAVGVIKKPVDIDALLKHVKQYCG